MGHQGIDLPDIYPAGLLFSARPAAPYHVSAQKMTSCRVVLIAIPYEFP